MSIPQTPADQSTQLTASSLSSEGSRKKRKFSEISRGFSTITSLESLKDAWSNKYSYKILDKKFIPRAENVIQEIPKEILSKLTSEVALSQNIVYAKGEKTLYFPIYDLLKYPLVLTGLHLTLKSEGDDKDLDPE